jgi:hypothetical protein
MSREVHVRFWEGLGVRFPRATRLVDLHSWSALRIERSSGQVLLALTSAHQDASRRAVEGSGTIVVIERLTSVPIGAAWCAIAWRRTSLYLGIGRVNYPRMGDEGEGEKLNDFN